MLWVAGSRTGDGKRMSMENIEAKRHSTFLKKKFIFMKLFCNFIVM